MIPICRDADAFSLQNGLSRGAASSSNQKSGAENKGACTFSSYTVPVLYRSSSANQKSGAENKGACTFSSYTVPVLYRSSSANQKSGAEN